MSSRLVPVLMLGAIVSVSAIAIGQGFLSPAHAQHRPVAMTLDEPVPDTAASVTDRGVRVSLSVDQSVVTPDDRAGHVMIDVQGLEDSLTRRPPVAMAIVVDTSGSMSGDKIANARLAAAELIHRLHEGDVVSVISYSDSARNVVDNRVVGEDRSSLLTTVSGLDISGNTCISCGLYYARNALDRAPSTYVRRMVLLSDGQANRGETSAAGLQSIAEIARGAGIVTSSIGLGHDYNETLMAAIATGGTGTFYFLPRASEIATIFTRELHDLERTIARDVRVTIETGIGIRLHALGHGNGTNGLRITQLSAGESRQFVYSVAYPAGVLGRVVGVTVEWADADGTWRTHSLTATVERSEDLARAQASVDARVIERAEFVGSLTRVETAMEQAVAGDRGGAVRELEQVVTTLEAQAASTGSRALQQEAANIQGLLDAVEEEDFDADGAEGRGLYLQNMARSREAASGAPQADMYHGSTLVD